MELTASIGSESIVSIDRIGVIKSISAVELYYVTEGRNAWHSTWSVSRSSEMFISNKYAYDYKTTWRTQGSVINIHSTPAILITSESGVVAIYQDNFLDPFTFYSL